jgi:hypothetical protein
MSKPTVSVAGGAMPAEGHKSRRALLRLFGAAPALAILPATALAASPRGSDADGEIRALSSEVLGRCAAADQFMSERIWPFDGQFEHLVHDDPRPAEERIAAAFAFSVETGRDTAIGELADFEEETDRIFRRMMAIPATTQPGRAAKVRALLVHAMLDNWHGPAEQLDGDNEMARALLGEFAGMTEEELAGLGRPARGAGAPLTDTAVLAAITRHERSVDAVSAVLHNGKYQDCTLDNPPSEFEAEIEAARLAEIEALEDVARATPATRDGAIAAIQHICRNNGDRGRPFGIFLQTMINAAFPADEASEDANV